MKNNDERYVAWMGAILGFFIGLILGIVLTRVGRDRYWVSELETRGVVEYYITKEKTVDWRWKPGFQNPTNHN